MSLEIRWLAGLLHFDDGASLVLAAFGAGVMGKLKLIAVSAAGDTRGGKKVVRTALGRTLLRMATLGIRHRVFPFNKPTLTLHAICV